MNPSQQCYNNIKDFEFCSLTPYKDSAGVWTDGWGNTNGVAPGQTITQEKAEQDLQKNVSSVAIAINQAVKVPLTQGQFDALVSFVFNVGVVAFLNSTLLKLLNQGDYKGAQGQFQRWVYVTDPQTKKKRILTGLQTRRAAEAALFGSASDTTESSYTPIQPPSNSHQTTTGKISIGVIGTGVAAAVVQGVQSMQPIITAAQTANQSVSGLPSFLKWIAIALTIGTIIFGVFTFIHKQKTLQGN